jgi:hypothetical protein
MYAATRTSPLPGAEGPSGGGGMQRCVAPIVGRLASPHAGVDSEQKRTATARVFIAAENRLLREALGRMLNKRGGIEVIGSDSAGPFQSSELLEGQVDVLLLISGGDLEEDLAIVRKAHSAAPGVRIHRSDARKRGVSTMRARGNQRLFVARGIRRRCRGGHQGGAERRGGVPGNALHGAISLL